MSVIELMHVFRLKTRGCMRRRCVAGVPFSFFLVSRQWEQPAGPIHACVVLEEAA